MPIRPEHRQYYRREWQNFRLRRRRATETGQAWLLPELEWAPFASWEIPGWIYDRMVQLRLFDGE